ncbi:MAG TPA: hypothetical protein VFQ60_05465 [Patescibacteria group bacterium]|nr:hypothetical protein [Patescibacteria group bacterium]
MLARVLSLTGALLTVSGCAHTEIAKPSYLHRHLVVQAPRSILGTLQPSEYRLALLVISWRENPQSADSARFYTYCDVRPNAIECLSGDINYANVTFVLQAIRVTLSDLVPAERVEAENLPEEKRERFYEPKALCGTVKIGLADKELGWSEGGNSFAKQWMTLVSTGENHCVFNVPREFLFTESDKTESRHQRR